MFSDSTRETRVTLSKRGKGGGKSKTGKGPKKSEVREPEKSDKTLKHDK